MSFIPENYKKEMEKRFKKIYPRTKEEWEKVFEESKNAPVISCFICGNYEFGIHNRIVYICEDCLRKDKNDFLEKFSNIKKW